MIFDKQTQRHIKKTARNLVKKHRNMVAKYSSDYANMDRLALHHAIVTVNEKLRDLTNFWAMEYWSEVKKQIKSKL